MGSRNFGLSRQMDVAGRIALKNGCSKGDYSFTSIASLGQRWKAFCEYAKNHGISRMEKITREIVIAYGKELAEKAAASGLTNSTAQNAISAVNTVMKLVCSWQIVSPVRDCQIGQRTGVRTVAPKTDGSLQKANQNLTDRPRELALVSLCRNLGLRSKEASLLNARTAYKQALKTGSVRISLGTKGGRARVISITSEVQIETLKNAAAVQGRGRSIMPSDKNWRQWREGALRHARETVGGLHELRAAYACDRYKQLTGHDAPVIAGRREADKAADRAARKVLTKELGHGRIDVVAAYIGSCK